MRYIKRALSKTLVRWFAPYKITFVSNHVNSYLSNTETHYSWTYVDALEWTACALRNDDVVYIHNRYNKFRNKDRLIAWRYSV